MPSLSALPPNIRIIVPSMPSNFTCPLSRVLTSARAGAADKASRVQAIAQDQSDCDQDEFDDVISGASVWGAHRFYTWRRRNAEVLER